MNDIENKGNKGLLQGMKGWSQFFFFWFLFFSGMMLFYFVAALVVDINQMDTSPRVMRMAQMIYQVCTFLVPALAFAYLSQENARAYLKTGKRTNMPFLLLSIVLILAMQPVVDLLAYYNQQMSLPESMSLIEDKMRAAEFAAERAVGLLFVDRSVFGLVFNLLIIAVVAGLVEELFFRGCLQQIIYKMSKNEHVAVWVGAAIFSAIHFQFFGFVPRLLLGALLGYLFVWSRNLWVPIIVHTVNNAISVIFAYIYLGTPEYEKMKVFNLKDNIWFITSGIVISLVLIVILYKRRVKIS